MLSYPQSRVLTTSNTHPQGMALDADACVPHSRLQCNYVHTLDSPMPAPTTYRYLNQSPTGGHHLGTNPWSLHNPYLWHANPVCAINSVLPASPQINQQTQDKLLLWRSANAQMVPESFPSPSLPTMENEICRDDITTISHTACHPSPNDLDTFADSRETSDAPRAPHDPSKHLDGPNANRSLSFSSHMTRSLHPTAPDDQNAAEPFVPRPLPSHQAFSPPSPHWSSHHPGSTEPLEPDTRFHFVPPQDPTISFCRRRGTRAFELSGVRLDEEELIKSLTEADGRLVVFQCRWEENDSPCHLWIKGDKSCINLHIQRWHGGQPGGDKLEVECHWSGCNATMLKESIARHIVNIHLGEKWECRGCGKVAARYDVHKRHTVRSNLEACQISGALTTYSADARVIDARAALDSESLRADA